MQISRAIASSEIAVRRTTRRVANPLDTTRTPRGNSRRGYRGTTTARLLPRSFLSTTNKKPRRTTFLRSTDPENQTVVDDETTLENNIDETEIEEKEKSEDMESVYDGPGAELLERLKEAESDLVESVLPDLQQQLQDLAQERSEAEGSCAAMEEELEETKSKYLRLSADFDNFRKRADSQRDQLQVTTRGNVIEALLPLVDNFELARTQVKPQNENEEAIVTSFMGLYRQMVDLFAQLGVEAIDCDQKPFDPEFHDAIMREQNEDLPDGTVIEELRKGFTMNGKLLRPAMVKVSYSEDVLQGTELPMEENESTIDLNDTEDSPEASEE